MYHWKGPSAIGDFTKYVLYTVNCENWAVWSIDGIPRAWESSQDNDFHTPRSWPGLAFRLSRSVLSTIPPPIPRAKAWGSAYTPSPGRPLLDMSQGVPGSPPPDILLDALAKTSSSPLSSGYGHVLGEPKLRSTFAQEMKTVYGPDADVNAEDIAFTSGCNMAFIATVMCLADVGDEVILPVPWYFNHHMSLSLLAIKSVPLYTRSDDGFLPSPAECKKLITSKTKAIALVTPNNPTGAIYSPALIAEFAELAHQNNIALIVDETYRDFVEHYPPHRLFSPIQSDTLQPPAVPELLHHVTTTLDCLQICAPRPPQLALADSTILTELRSSILENAKALKARHEIFRKSLPSGWTIGSQGGYFAFVKHPFQNVTSLEFCQRLAQELGVLALPAQFFSYERDDLSRQALGLSEDGWDRWIRFSVANVDDEKILEVCERLKECKAHFG
ncbi:pyridoxal phosphate-dependent transferase [Melanogaster broomeanus]|nr:pyridoxal phosphate-dependent transferase [Melanogaster broomeanus]